MRKEREERGERQEQPPAPPLCPFDLDADEIRQRPPEDDQEIILAEPTVRKRLEVPVQIFEEPLVSPRVDILRETEKPD